MKPLALEDLPAPEVFEAMRADLRAALIAHKRARRVALGERVSLVFEDRETVRWQVLEMARVERIRDPAALQHELDVYNALVPGDDALSATLFIEIPDLASIRSELDRLVGLDRHLALLLGEGEGALRVAARFDPAQMEEDRISAVHYVRFDVAGPARERLAERAVPARLVVDHPSYRAEARLEPETRASLLRDLAGGPPPFLGVRAPAAGAAADDGEVVAEEGRVRARRPAAPRAPGHVVLEPREDVAFAAADPALFGELAALAQRLAPELAARHGRVRLHADVDGPLRLHLLAG